MKKGLPLLEQEGQILLLLLPKKLLSYANKGLRVRSQGT